MRNTRRMKLADNRLEELGINDGFAYLLDGDAMTTLLSLHCGIALNEYEICQTNIRIFRGILDSKIRAAIKACRCKLDQIEKGLDNA